MTDGVVENNFLFCSWYPCSWIF